MKSKFVRPLIVCASTLLLAIVSYVVLAAAITIPTGVPYTQNFDAIGTAATAALPADFRADRLPTVRTVGTFAGAATATGLAGGANLGGTAQNGIYNFGSGTTTTGPDRAIGFLSAGTTPLGTQSGNLYAQLANTSGSAMSGLQVSYNVEKYRTGSNLAGFRIQLFYSTDGAAWTTAGPSFATSFGADAANAGFSPAPGASVPVAAVLNVPIPAGATFYLAWNYSVSTGSTTTNAQALAIDDISILGIGGGGGGQTNPSATTGASPSTVPAGQTTTLSATVTPGTNPTSTGIAVSGNLTSIGGSAAQSFFDDGTHGDVTPGDLTFTFTAPVAAATTPGAKSLPVTITDAESRSASAAIALTVSAADAPPTVTSSTPAPSATNVPVTSSVVINFSEPVNASPGAFSIECPVGAQQTFTPSASPASTFTLTPAAPFPYATVCTVTVSGTQVTDIDGAPDSMVGNRTFSFTTANAPPPGAGIVIINEVDADTPGSDTAEFVELYDGGAGNTPLDGLIVVFYDGLTTATGNQSYAAFDLDGYHTDANGYFIMGNPGVPGASLIFDPGMFGLLQNGPDAVALYIGNTTDFPNGTTATTTNILDAIVYGTDDPSAPNLLPLLNAGQTVVNENATGNGTIQSSQRCPNGLGGVRNSTPYYPGAPSPGHANNCPAPRPPSDVVISQLYGGGGNGGATYRNDFVELFNKGGGPVDLTGWSVQYASSTGSGWDSNKQPLGGTIGAGEYYLVALASGGATGASLPPANIAGQINMAAGSGKVALVNSFDGLAGNCPIFDAHIMDFVGYGSADCGEGSTTTAAGSNSTALFRKGDGNIDTDNNGNDFNAPAAPLPRRTAPIVELGPLLLSLDPRANGINAPRDATIQVTFTEPVAVDAAWFNLTCAGSGAHNSATFAESFGGRDQYITPNDNFIAGEQCTVMIRHDRVHDLDLDDAGPNTDTLPADYSWSFTVATGTAPPYSPSVHLTTGNPSGAGADPLNYLMEKPEFALSYNRDLGRPNWVSWHLSDEWVGTLTRVDTFRPDPQVPPDWYRVQSFDFAGSGFDRGHMTPNADRDKETSVPINQATFLMSNMVAQAPANNQGPWADLEGYLRTLTDPANPVEPGNNELYIVAGPAGVGGTGSLGGVTTTLANGHVTVPSSTWKVVLVLPKDGGDDVSRVTCSTRTIAVIMPNTQAINGDWHTYLTTVDAVETLTGYDLFSNLPEPIQQCVEAGINGNNPPLVKGNQTITFPAPPDHAYGDAPFTVSATGGASGNPVTFAASGACTSGGLNGATISVVSPGSCTITASQAGSNLYNAAPDVVRTLTVTKTSAVIAVTGYAGVYDGAAHGATGTATGVGGEDLNALLHLGASFTDVPGGTAHWTFDGNANYEAASGNVTIAISTRALSVVVNNKSRSRNAPNPPLDGTVTGLVPGDGITVTYSTTAANVPGAYPITATLVDPNGKLGNYTVSITNGTMLVTDGAPVAVADGPYTLTWNSPLTIAPSGVLTNDTDADGDPLTAIVVTGPSHGTLSLNANGGFTYTPAADFSGTDSFTYKANDGFADSAAATAALVITSPCSVSSSHHSRRDDDEWFGWRGDRNDWDTDDCQRGTPIARDDAYKTDQGETLTVTASRDILENDGRYAAAALLVSGPAHGALTLNPNGTFVYVPDAAYFGLDSFVYAARSASGVVGPVAMVKLTVRKNLAPDADNDFYSVKTNATLTIAAAGVLKNDSDPDDDALTAAVVTGPSHGTLTLAANGGFVYKPAPNFTGTDTFTYRAVDAFGHVDTATVSIKVSHSGRDDDDHHGDESHHRSGDDCDHERGRNGHFRGDRCEHDRRG